MGKVRFFGAVVSTSAVLVMSAGGASAGAIVVAVDDLYDTPHNTPVAIDPLENDNLPEAEITVFYDTPSNGTVNDAGDQYTPNNGFSGTDEFEYEVCFNYLDNDLASVRSAAERDFDLCDTATIYVNVGAPPATTTTTVAPTTTTTPPTTVALQATPATTTTTVAAVAAELPRTGQGNGGLTAALGLGLLGVGFAFVSFGRRGRIA